MSLHTWPLAFLGLALLAHALSQALQIHNKQRDLMDLESEDHITAAGGIFGGGNTPSIFGGYVRVPLHVMVEAIVAAVVLTYAYASRVRFERIRRSYTASKRTFAQETFNADFVTFNHRNCVAPIAGFPPNKK
eukprot:PhM_4_TR15814/c0_g1_i1/m.87961